MSKFKMEFREYMDQNKDQNNEHEWTEHDEFMRKHAPIRPPEVKMCWLCKNKSVGRCEDCQKYVCQGHLRTCSVCHAKICIICYAGEEYGESYCQDCSE